MRTQSPPPIPFQSIRLASPPQIFMGEPQWQWETVIPEYFNLWIALEGYGRMFRDGKESRIHPGSAFILTPGQRISATHDASRPIRNLAIHLIPQPDSLDVRAKFISSTPSDIQIRDMGRIAEFSRAAVQSCRHRDALAIQQTAGLCYQVLAQIWRDGHSKQPPEPDSLIQRQIERMEEQPSRGDSSSELAREANLSISQFNRRFTALAGETPAQFAIRHRIRRACELLCDSPLQIGEIADALGYRDIYYFSRQFKQVMNCSPLHYRQESCYS